MSSRLTQYLLHPLHLILSSSTLHISHQYTFPPTWVPLNNPSPIGRWDHSRCSSSSCCLSSLLLNSTRTVSPERKTRFVVNISPSNFSPKKKTFPIFFRGSPALRAGRLIEPRPLHRLDMAAYGCRLHPPVYRHHSDLPRIPPLPLQHVPRGLHFWM